MARRGEVVDVRQFGEGGEGGGEERCRERRHDDEQRDGANGEVASSEQCAHSLPLACGRPVPQHAASDVPEARRAHDTRE